MKRTLSLLLLCLATLLPGHASAIMGLGIKQHAAVPGVPPTFATISPNNGSISGGQTVTITGTQFVSGSTSVSIGGGACIGVSVTGTTSLTCSTPTGSGLANVAVTTGGGTSSGGVGVYFFFLPTDLATLEFWVYAGAGITLGTGVSAWADQSGTGDTNKTLRQSTGSKQPTLNSSDSSYNNQATLSFARPSSQYLQSTTWASALSLPETLVVVGNMDNAATSEYFADGLVLNSRTLYNNILPSTIVMYNGVKLSGTVTSNAVPAVVVAYFDSSTSSALYYSAITALNSGSAGTSKPTRTGLTAGADGSGGLYLNGKIADIEIYSGALTTANRTLVTDRDGFVYGITVGP